MTDEMTNEVDETTEHPEPVEATETKGDTFDRAYVEKLRAEAAEHRVKAKEAQEALDAAQERYRALALTHASNGILKAVDALTWQDEWTGEDGTADLEAITAAATQYADRYPHAAVVSGDVGQGFRGESASSVDLASMLRAGA